MYHSEEITLISENDVVTDENGIQRTSKAARWVFGDIDSVTGEEMVRAAARGFKAMCRVKVWAEEYGSELLADVGGKRLVIYRTYLAGEKIELYMGERLGEQGEGNGG